MQVLFKSHFRTGNEKRAWGPLIVDLKAKSRSPKPDAALLAHLDHLRERFRNPTDHPDKTYDIEEAEDLVHLVVDVINRCMRDKKVQQYL